jgi:hypothetical protein
MPTIVADNSKLAANLMIHEFDQWSNPYDPAFSPTCICWGQDVSAELTE